MSLKVKLARVDISTFFIKWVVIMRQGTRIYILPNLNVNSFQWIRMNRAKVKTGEKIIWVVNRRTQTNGWALLNAGRVNHTFILT